MKRLDSQTLLTVPADVLQPQYDRNTIKAGIVHLGIGAFHRAHQAWYTNRVLSEYGGDWGIVGCSLRSASVKDQLQPQDGLYTLMERGAEGEKFEIIGSVKSLVVGPESPQALVSIMAEESVKIVSLTVTEKGYCHDPATGNLNLSNADIQHDLKNIEQPKSAPGFILAALLKRQQAGLSGLTLLSCDNLPDNGHVLRKVMFQFAEQFGGDLLSWIEKNVSFPCSMVDRIVPATTASDRDLVQAKLGLQDEGAVVAEPFSQWVVEDNFACGRPDWEKVGVMIVPDVRAYEAMKLRLLNGSHSLLAYCGYLSGCEYISDTMNKPALVSLVKRFMDDEVSSTLDVPEGFDLSHYKEQLRERFANPGLKHRTWQVAMDGSQKLPQRQVATLCDQLRGEGKIDIACFALAAWMRYTKGLDEKGEAIDVQDPFADKFKEVWQQSSGDSRAVVQGFLALEAIFGADLCKEERVIERISTWLELILSQGIVASVDALNKS